MLTLPGGLSIVMELDREVSYAAVESALNSERFVSPTSYMIDLSSLPGRTQLVVSLHIPTESITADGVPDMPAVQVLRALANAMEVVERGR